VASSPPPPSPATGGLGTVLVTGAASGLGAAVVAAVRAAGGRPLALDRVPVAGVPHELVDLADTRAAEDAVRRLVDGAGGTLDAVVTAAGTDTPAPLEKLDGAAWDTIVAVNLLGTAAVVRASLPYLRASDNARVVTVASTLGHRVFGDATAYCASKFGVVGFTRSLQAELKGDIGVTLLTPGGMSTAFFDDRDEQYKPGPDARLNRPEDVAANVLHVLTQPPGCVVYDLVVASAWEGSWP
jgi:NAD(P)-dependent dehydrogenase (short-subunit alcohol dehydrogenase family)